MIYVRNASGTGTEEVLVSPPARSFPTDWSPDGRHVLLMLNGGATRTDIWSYDLLRRTAAPLLASVFDEGWATFSPDGGTLFANIQVPGTTFAIWGPWR